MGIIAYNSLGIPRFISTMLIFAIFLKSTISVNFNNKRSFGLYSPLKEEHIGVDLVFTNNALCLDASRYMGLEGLSNLSKDIKTESKTKSTKLSESDTLNESNLLNTLEDKNMRY